MSGVARDFPVYLRFLAHEVPLRRLLYRKLPSAVDAEAALPGREAFGRFIAWTLPFEEDEAVHSLRLRNGVTCFRVYPRKRLNTLRYAMESLPAKAILRS